MADLAAVTDTHPLLFFAAGGRRLGRKASALFAACERREAILYVPAVVLWETALVRGGRVIRTVKPPTRVERAWPSWSSALAAA